MNRILKIDNVSFRYSGKDDYALRNASVEFQLEGISVIVGESGIGKSTLISLLAGIYIAGDPVISEYEGQILIDGRTPSEIRGCALVSWVPQMPALLDHLTVLENILLPMTIGGSSSPTEASVLHILKELQLEGRSNSRPRELSVGMKSRVSLLRALVSKPTYLFLDEPFVSLDLKNRWRIYELLRAERRGGDTATILTTHDIPEAFILADRIIRISREDHGRTIIAVAANTAKLDSGENRDACLKAAREAAASIEKQLFLVNEEVRVD